MASPILLIEFLIRLVTAERARSASEPILRFRPPSPTAKASCLARASISLPVSLGASGVVKSLGLFQVSSEIVQAVLVFGLGLRVQDRTSIGQESVLPGTSGTPAFSQYEGLPDSSPN